MNEMEIRKIYDNGGETFDRYSVIFTNGCFLGMSHNPRSPQGFSQWSDENGYVDGPHLGEEIDFDELPEEVQERLNEISYGDL